MSKIKNIQGNNDNFNQNFKYVPTVQIYIMNKKLSKMISTLFVYRIRIETFSQQCVCPKNQFLLQKNFSSKILSKAFL